MQVKNIFIFIFLYFYIINYNEYILTYFCGMILFPIYFITDFLFYKLKYDAKIHHILGLMLVTSLIINKNKSTDIIYPIVNFQFSTEISTIYLILFEEFGKIKSNNIIYSILYYTCQLLFIITFFYYRIYNFFLYQKTIVELGKNIEYNFLYYISTYGIFYMNLFWSFLILKKMYKKFLKDTKYDSQLVKRKLCSYTNFFIYLSKRNNTEMNYQTMIYFEPNKLEETKFFIKNLIKLK